MKRLLPLLLVVSFAVENGWSARPLPGAERGRPLGVLEDFHERPVGAYQKGRLDSWRWQEAMQEQARRGSRLEVIEREQREGRMLRVAVDDPQLLAGEPLPIIRLAPHYPPEADAVRLRLQVRRGKVVLFVGGPTAYYGNSDVFSEPQTIRASDPPEWVEVVCNLNHPTWRNFRRAGFSAEAPRNYYLRWAQEPVGVYLAAGTEGEILIDQIDLVALGEGRPFPTFAPEQVAPRKPIADFEDGRLDNAFTLYMANNETEWFEASWRRDKPLRFRPTRLTVDAHPASEVAMGRRSLVSVGQTAEEVHCAGLRTTGDANSNGLRAIVAIEASDNRNTLVGVGPAEPLDFLVFVAPPAKAFPWDRFGPSAELRALGGPGFDYQFSHRLLGEVTDADFAIYQARRYLKPGEWTSLALPAADFTCIYGHGAYRDHLLAQRPLDCGDVIAVAWLNPWRRVGRSGPTTTRIDQLDFVHLPGTPAEHRSFWQAPDVRLLQRRESTNQRGRTLHFSLPGDKTPEAR